MMRLLAAITAILVAHTAATQEVRHDAVNAWLEAYEAAWETRDSNAVARLFTDDARYFETPWSEPFLGPGGIADYWSGVTADQRNIDFQFDIVAVNGARAVARWSASFETASSGTALALDGVFILEFAAGGIVSELREWWVLQP